MNVDYLLRKLSPLDDNDVFETPGGASTCVGVMVHLLRKCPAGAEVLAYDVSEDDGEIIGLQIQTDGQEKWVHAND